jgi:hypothetical protein
MARQQRNGGGSSPANDDDQVSEAALAPPIDAQGIGLDDAPAAAAPADDDDSRDVDGIPYCPLHHCRMIQASGAKSDNPKAYYKCKAPNCKTTARVIKTPDPRVVPDRLQACPRCTRDDSPAICERDPKSSTAAMVILKCPRCGWKSTGMAVPQLAAAHFARGNRKPEFVEEIGAR